MFPVTVQRRMEYIILLSVVATTLIVTPGINSDPINLPKLLILSVCGFALLGNALPYFKSFSGSLSRPILLVFCLFVLAITSVMIFSDTDKSAQFFGTYGRNTGWLAYFSLAIILTFSSFLGRENFAQKLSWSLIFTGAINCFYGLIQWSGNDPVNWDNPYNPIVGTLGNPNFVSAHLGIASLTALSIALDQTYRRTIRLLLLAYISGAVFVISRSDSSQGFLVLAAISTVIVYLRYLREMHRIVRVSYGFFVMSGLSLGFLGVLQRGPLSSILYQESVTYRGDYWRAGLKMSFENPLLGVGLDSYGDWYRFFRTETAALRRGPDVTTNSAHNVFLDMFSNGGFPLLLIYLVFLGFVLKSAIRILKRINQFDAISTSLVSSWLAYLMQSTISINQLGLAIWGWVLGGAIIGRDLQQRQTEIISVAKQKKIHREQVPAANVLMGSIGVLFGILISIWPVEKDASFVSAIKSSDGSALEKAVDKFPRSSYHYVYISRILLANEFKERALEMSRRAIEVNPRDFNAWKSLIENPLLIEPERVDAITTMKQLDPFNYTLDN